MFAATNCWRTVDLSDAAARKWVDRGNAVLDKPGAAAHMLETQDVYTLVQRFHEHESDQPPFTENDPNQAWPCQAWPLTVSTLDWFARSLASTVMDSGWTTRLAAGNRPRSAPSMSRIRRTAAAAARTGSRWPSGCDGPPRLHVVPHARMA